MSIVYQGKTRKGKEIIIRYPEIGDLAELLGFINALSNERTFIRYQGEHETLESEGKWLKERLKQIENKEVIHLLTFYNNKLVGASEVRMKDKTEKHIGAFGISIAKDFRGEGLGNILMDSILKEAKKKLNDLKIVTLEVYSANEIAKNLYKKMGFIDYGILPEGITRNNKFEDAILMYKKP